MDHKDDAKNYLSGLKKSLSEAELKRLYYGDWTPKVQDGEILPDQIHGGWAVGVRDGDSFRELTEREAILISYHI